MGASPNSLPTVAARLHQDHLNFARLLNVLGRQQRLLRAGDPINWDIERGVVAFYRNYFEKFHHRVEDDIYDLVQQYDPATANRVRAIHREHKDCSELLQIFEGAVSLISGSRPTTAQEDGRPKVFYETKVLDHYCSQLESFVSREREHMSNEETLLHRAVKHLSLDDWRGLNERLSEGDDDLFGKKQTARFDRLRDAILAADNPAHGEKDDHSTSNG